MSSGGGSMAFKYQQLAERQAKRIAANELQAGAALPSLRRYAEHHNVSLSTASKAYQWLEQQGLIQAEAKRGYFVCAQSGSPIQAPKLEAQLVSGDSSDVILNVLHSALREDLLSFGGAFLSADFLPVLELQRCLTRAARRNPNAAYSYGLEQGDSGLRQALCERMAERNCHLQPEQLLITNGCLEAVTLAILQLTNVGDVVAIFSPCYSGLLLSLQNCGRKILEIPCGPQGPDLDALEALMAVGAFKALVFSAIGYNPLGFNLSVSAKQRLASLAARYQIPAIEDDTFGELAFTGEESSPVFSYENSCEELSCENSAEGSAGEVEGSWLVYCSSFSKSLAAGYRVGWLATRGPIAPLLKRKLALNLTSSLPAQVGLADYLFSEGYRAHLNRLRSRLECELNRMRQAVVEYFPVDTQVSSPRGGLFLWLRLPAGVASMDLYQEALKCGICIGPGETFSMAGLAEDCIRLTVCEAWSGERERGIQKLGNLVRQLQQ